MSKPLKTAAQLVAMQNAGVSVDGITTVRLLQQQYDLASEEDLLTRIGWVGPSRFAQGKLQRKLHLVSIVRSSASIAQGITS